MLFFIFFPKFFHGLVKDGFYCSRGDVQFSGDFSTFFVFNVTHDDHLSTPFR